VEEDFVLQRRLDVRPGLERHAIEHGIHVLERADLHFQPELHLDDGVPGALFLELDLVVLELDVDIRERDVLLRIEVVNEVLVREDLLAQHDPLARVHTAEVPVASGRPRTVMGRRVWFLSKMTS